MESKYDYVVFDIETTGLHPESDQICEIAAIGVKDGLPQGLFSTLVAIEGSMPEAAGRVNGITDDYQIKGFFKDACSALRRVPGTRSSKLTAFKKVIDGTVFVEQRRIPFQLPEGAECGRCERPLRASSASGERVALAASETVPAGTVLEFSILVMNPKDAETVREWLDYGALRGLFQWRNSGKGRFEWEEVARD